MEVKREVKPIQVSFLCPKCNNGFLEVKNESDTNLLRPYNHQCTNCDHSEYLAISYPYMEYVADTIKFPITKQEYVDSINYNNEMAIQTLGVVKKLTINDLD